MYIIENEVASYMKFLYQSTDFKITQKQNHVPVDVLNFLIELHTKFKMYLFRPQESMVLVTNKISKTYVCISNKINYAYTKKVHKIN